MRPWSRRAERFRDEYYESQVWSRTTWLGHAILKCPLDMWRYQELIVERYPDVLVETGTWEGGSAIFFAGIMEQIGHGRVITIDIEARKTPEHPRIQYVAGDSLDSFGGVASMIADGDEVMCVLDSCHEPEHVAQELELYSRLVTPGQLLVCEDTNPYELNGKQNNLEVTAVRKFLISHPEFSQIEEPNKFGVTFNPGGWLERTS